VTESTTQTLKPRQLGDKTAYQGLSQIAACHAEQTEREPQREVESVETGITLHENVVAAAIKKWGHQRKDGVHQHLLHGSQGRAMPPA
jgi:hypothetical protein